MFRVFRWGVFVVLVGLCLSAAWGRASTLAIAFGGLAVGALGWLAEPRETFTIRRPP